MTTEMEVIEQLLRYLVLTGFITGLFLSHRFIDAVYFVYRVYKWRKRKNRASVYERTVTRRQ